MAPKNYGFTLIELLIVITIIVILSVIGSVAYLNILRNARDSAKKADLESISNALEVNKTEAGYIPLQIGQFSKFSVIDPTGNNYCISSGFPFTPTVTSPWGLNCPPGYLPVAPGSPTGSFSAWKLCAFIENPPIGSLTNAFCKTQSQ